jgi:hypothetical protein
VQGRVRRKFGEMSATAEDGQGDVATPPCHAMPPVTRSMYGRNYRVRASPFWCRWLLCLAGFPAKSHKSTFVPIIKAASKRDFCFVVLPPAKANILQITSLFHPTSFPSSLSTHVTPCPLLYSSFLKQQPIVPCTDPQSNRSSFYY